MDEFDGESGVLVRISLEIEVKRAYPLGLNGIVKVRLLVEFAIVHELLLDEAVIIKRVCK
jgi:hypothetical protein